MKTLDVITPQLVTAVDRLDQLENGLDTQVLDMKEASIRNAAVRTRVAIVGQELKNRVAMPRLIAMEARMNGQEAAAAKAT